MATDLVVWNSGALPGVIGSPVINTSFGMPSAPSIEMPAGSGSCNVRATVTARGELGIRFYVHLPASWPTASFVVCAMRRAGGSTLASFAIAGSGAPGQARILTSSGATAKSSPDNAVVVGGIYRVELLYSASATSLTAAVYDADGGLVWTATHTDAALNTNVDRIDIGRPNVNPVVDTYHVDSIRIRDTAEPIGPEPADPPPPTSTVPKLKIWDGTQLVTVTKLSVWDGSQLLPVKKLSVWDGTQLRPVI